MGNIWRAPSSAWKGQGRAEYRRPGVQQVFNR